MEKIYNLAGKCVCRLDRRSGIVEIVKKGKLTLIHFKPDGTIEIIHK